MIVMDLTLSINDAAIYSFNYLINTGEIFKPRWYHSYLPLIQK